AVLAVVAVALVAGAWYKGWGFGGSATAKAPSIEELMERGPLNEQALGKPDAPITIIEYASVSCSHCANFHTKVFPVLKSKYIDTGQVRFIMREFPFDQHAAAGFMLARCAGDDKYFAMLDLLFEQQSTWLIQGSLEPLKTLAKQAGFSES